MAFKILSWPIGEIKLLLIETKKIQAQMDEGGKEQEVSFSYVQLDMPPQPPSDNVKQTVGPTSQGSME